METPAPTHLIIGGLSQDGKVLSRLLSKKGYNLIKTSRSYVNTKADARQDAFLKLDPANTFEVLKLLQRYRPDTIYMLSAQSSVGLSFDFPADTFHSNIMALISLLEAVGSLDYQPTIFYPLSTDMFGECDSPATEASPFSPASPYAISKVSCYEYIKYHRSTYGTRIYTAFLSNHESIYRSSHFVTHKLALAAITASQGSNMPIRVGNLNIIRDWGWSEEYMSIILKILSLKEPDDFIVATGNSYSLRQLAESMFSYLGLDYTVHLEESRSYQRKNDILCSRLSNKKLQLALGETPCIDAPQVAHLLIDNYQKIHE